MRMRCATSMSFSCSIMIFSFGKAPPGTGL
ncbi:hypothetical protein Paride_0402 [Pseudomonas phage Paride]|nr:hypothetical protein Paride_0402 [Pseudomonas phage Paride]